MANQATFKPRTATRKKRKGVHAKAKTSKLVSSKIYAKRYRGQGK